MKYFLIAGEASGDLHGSNLIKSIKREDPEAKFVFWGGDLMAKEALSTPKKHIKELAIMGFVEVVANLNTITKNIKACKKEVQQFMPDAIIFIDFPGFNLRIAPFAKSLGIKTYYYISPKVWAWKKNRVLKIKQSIDTLFSILPFEVEFYQQFDYPIQYVGNPLLDAIASFKAKEVKLDWKQSEKPIIALLPGSRMQELKRMLPSMIAVADSMESHDIIIAGAPNFTLNDYQTFFNKRPYQVVFDQTYSLLSQAEAAIVTSGTATLETALFNVPQVVCYKANKASYHIAKNLVDIKYISLVNLILDKAAVLELIQHDMNEIEIKKELLAIIVGGQKRDAILNDYDQLNQIMGDTGASDRVAKEVFSQLKNERKNT
jgi:lipid-A-disaccharide synthase